MNSNSLLLPVLPFERDNSPLEKLDQQVIPNALSNQNFNFQKSPSKNKSPPEDEVIEIFSCRKVKKSKIVSPSKSNTKNITPRCDVDGTIASLTNSLFEKPNPLINILNEIPPNKRTIFCLPKLKPQRVNLVEKKGFYLRYLFPHLNQPHNKIITDRMIKSPDGKYAYILKIYYS
jgi:hypothetical protein